MAKSEEKNKSGKETGKEHVNKLAVYLEGLRKAQKGLPNRSGKINVTAITVAAKLPDRQVLYKNPACKSLLEAAVKELGLSGMETRDDQADNEKVTLERRITRLEAQNSALYAENQELRSRLQQYHYIEEMLISQGKRVAH